MRVPLDWLREVVDVPEGATGEDVAATLVRVGLEEEGLHGGDVTGPVVVGRVLSAQPEPQKNGKTINWCSVDVGADGAVGDDGAAGGAGPRGIVCGASNFAAGDLVVVALPGAELPGGFGISARKTYGHVSDGMICSARELGLGDEHDGIIVLTELLGEQADGLVPGQDALALLGLDAQTVEVNVTPDRGYCFSVRGIGREHAHGARTDVATSFRDPADVAHPAVTADGGFPVELDDEDPVRGMPGCTRFTTRVVRGIDATATTPFRVRRRLLAAGMRPISLVVDVANYVMLLTGQPLHTYDLAALTAPLVVRRARAGERLATLDGADRALHPEDLLVTDSTGGRGARPVGIAGVMGGASTEVGATTTDVLVEAAHFEPTTIARSARRHRLPSEASRRFERGVDPHLPPAAAELVVRMLVELGGGRAEPGAGDARPTGAGVDGADREPGALAALELPVSLVEDVTGVAVGEAEVVALLEQVGCTVEIEPTAPAGGGALRVTPPSWRPDLTQAVDLVEEVVRLHGYEHIPSVLPLAPPGRGLTRAQRARRAVSRTLVEQGLVEAVTYPFTAPGRADELGLTAEDPRRTAVRLANPLSDEQPLMRTSLLATLVDAVRRNTGRGNDGALGGLGIALFELGRVTLPTEVPREWSEALRPSRLPVDARPSDDQLAALDAGVPPQPVHVAAVLTGRREAAGWWGPGRVADHTDAIAAALAVGEAVGVELAPARAVLAPWHPGRCAALALPTGEVVGHAGELHPSVVTALGLPVRAVAFELDLDAVVGAAPAVVRAAPVAAYPLAKEDLALVVAEDVPAEDVRRALLAGVADAGLGGVVEEVRLFDVYTGAQLAPGQRSLAFSLRLRAPDRTLTAAETAAVRDAAVAGAGTRTGAVLRG